MVDDSNWTVRIANASDNIFKDKLGISLPKNCPITTLVIGKQGYCINTGSINKIYEIGIINNIGRIIKIANGLFFTEKVPLTKCTCDIMVLMRAGCQCGFINTERGL